MKTSPNDVSNSELLQEIRNEIRSSAESAKGEILETVQVLAQHMDERFDEVHRDFATKAELKAELSKFATKDDLQSLKNTLVTKGYLDDKLADHHSDIILHVDRRIEKALG